MSYKKGRTRGIFTVLHCIYGISNALQNWTTRRVELMEFCLCCIAFKVFPMHCSSELLRKRLELVESIRCCTPFIVFPMHSNPEPYLLCIGFPMCSQFSKKSLHSLYNVHPNIYFKPVAYMILNTCQMLEEGWRHAWHHHHFCRHSLKNEVQ